MEELDEFEFAKLNELVELDELKDKIGSFGKANAAVEIRVNAKIRFLVCIVRCSECIMIITIILEKR